MSSRGNWPSSSSSSTFRGRVAVCWVNRRTKDDASRGREDKTPKCPQCPYDMVSARYLISMCGSVFNRNPGESSPSGEKGRAQQTRTFIVSRGRSSVVQLYSRLAGCALSAMPLRRMGFLPPSFLYLLSRGPSLPSPLLSRWRKERGRRGKVDLAVKVSLSLFLLYSRGRGREELSQQCTTVVVVVLVCLLMCIRRLPPPPPSICRRRSHPFSLFFLTYRGKRKRGDPERREKVLHFLSKQNFLPLSSLLSAKLPKPEASLRNRERRYRRGSVEPRAQKQKPKVGFSYSFPPSLPPPAQPLYTIHCVCFPPTRKLPRQGARKRGRSR